MLFSPLHLASIVLALAGAVSGLGTTCSTPMGAGTSGVNDPFWMQSIKHQGTSAFNGDKSYTVFRNVKVCLIFDFGCELCVNVALIGLRCRW